MDVQHTEFYTPHQVVKPDFSS